MDFILNGAAHGAVASALLQNNFDPRILRPFVGKDNRSYVTVLNAQGKPVNITINTPATLRKDEWITIDEAVIKTARQRLKIVSDIRGAGLQYTIPGGMAKTILQTEKMSDAGEAEVSMDGLRESASDRPLFDIDSLPLPIVHSDFFFSSRQIAVSRNGSTPLDTTMAEQATRKVTEKIEQMFLGKGSPLGYAFAGATIYGLVNHPSINLKTITSPLAVGWTPATLLLQLLQMKGQAQTDKMYGPYMIYVAPAWDVYLDNDFSTAKGDVTLRNRIKMVEGFQDVRTLDYLTNYDIVMVQLTSDVIRAVIGMEITTVQWESKGGLQQNFKVMGIIVPQVRADYAGNSGIVYGSV